ncbi:MAG: DMT family transporter [Bacillota bacterium]|nr:DMT family transporter [Bacillota bacterium]
MEKKGILICIISAFCFSLGPITGKLLFSAGLPWQVVVSLRCMIPAMLILIYSLCFSREVFQIQKKHLPLFILDGASFSLFSVCNYCALYYIDAAVATVLVYTLPVFTVIFSRIILKEAFTAPKIIAMIMVFCGVLFIIEVFNISSLAVSDGTKVLGIPSSIFGILIGIMSGVLSAFYTIFTKKLNQY